jgi:hypothetical protein
MIALSIIFSERIMPGDTLLSIDVGTQSVRALTFDPAGTF